MQPFLGRNIAAQERLSAGEVARGAEIVEHHGLMEPLDDQIPIEDDRATKYAVSRFLRRRPLLFLRHELQNWIRAHRK